MRPPAVQLWPSTQGGRVIMKLAVRPTGGTAPEAPCRAPCNAPASGGGACRRLSPPKERQRRSRKRHSFLSRTRLRGQIEPWIFFCEIAGGKVTVIRLPPGDTAFPGDKVARLSTCASRERERGDIRCVPMDDHVRAVNMPGMYGHMFWYGLGFRGLKWTSDATQASRQWKELN